MASVGHANEFGWTHVSPDSPELPIGLTGLFSGNAGALTRILEAFSELISQPVQQQQTQPEIIPSKNSLLAYWLSPFSLLYLIMSLVINRIIIFASSRRNRRLPQISNLSLRLFALYCLSRASFGLLVACKSYLRDNTMIQFLLQSAFWDFNIESFASKSFLSLKFGEDYFYKIDSNGHKLTGPTTSILRPFHLSLCLSQVLETYTSVANGLRPSIETGITLFEYSLAFQEATPYEFPTDQLLYVGLIALANQLNIHLLGLFNMGKYRLISSSLIGFSTLWYYIYNLYMGEIIRMPFIIVVGYFPHFCILSVITFSHLIYILTSILRGEILKDLSMFNPMNNLRRANIQLTDDFYTSLILYGEFIINVSIKQSYDNEYEDINLPIGTYLDDLAVNGYSVEYNEHPDVLKRKLDKLNNKLNGSIRRKVNSMHILIKKLFVLIMSKTWGYHKLIGDAILNTSERSKSVDEINVNALTDEDLNENYANYILNGSFNDQDESSDYDFENIDSDTSSDVAQDANNDDDDDDDDQILLNELVTPQEFQQLVLRKGGSKERILGYHMKQMNHPTQLTRSQFRRYYNDNMKLQDILSERREYNDSDDDDDSVEKLGLCVICHVNSRHVILWPCKCLALCDSCRSDLAERHFESCVCCRTPVEGFSRVFVP